MRIFGTKGRIRMHPGLSWIILGTAMGIAGAILLWVGQSQWSSRPDPVVPNITSSVSTNPIVNWGGTVTVVIGANPDFKPPYVTDIMVTIPNDNPYKCYMVLEFEASKGFKFLPISDALPENFRVEEGYEYQGVMKVSITDFAPKFHYRLKLSVYTLEPSSYGGTENISWKVLEQGPE